ncbi:anhydro-N-acetylmuramic acid kinase [Phormidium tenue]|uniref:Anhydro-N-acetylmuramic acid kinase n=1 Tax=Phormidium tenue NIES-30 TaxID=549789 RepID=A0A1U7J668_9CYAN|nr:anhydro-N-acetylmuramic acid kinase [Phormidium tenue]MBD2232023.1 anhydro-N-acetylmuramic acid kinase [Phormidium tenue FACHB-1052]OKH48385.1 anhydro-N-acetylmuramic acid kinase [Phormidium tenue NIES-30]
MRVIGLISGTSVDGIDAALVELDGQGYDLTVSLVEGLAYPYPDELRRQILALCAGEAIALDQLAALDDAVAQTFAAAAQALLAQAGPADLIASHGQTVFHRPVGRPARPDQGPAQLAYTLQLGRGVAIAQQTNLPTVSNFRQADIEAGGEGAPLAPIVDLCLLSHPTERRCVQNLGGIGNVAYLPPWNRQGSAPKVLGWDTGPANSLIDIAVHSLSAGALTYDVDGAWAAQGVPCLPLISRWLEHPYFTQPPPKSTGRELFGWDFFNRCRQDAQEEGLAPQDLVATLTEFTAASVAHEYRTFLPALPDRLLVCGGGSQNPVLMACLQAQLPEIVVQTTDAVGVSANYKEAIAFAVLGYWYRQGFPGNLPTVTGASRSVVLGQGHNIALPR